MAVHERSALTARDFTLFLLFACALQSSWCRRTARSLSSRRSLHSCRISSRRRWKMVRTKGATEWEAQRIGRAVQPFSPFCVPFLTLCCLHLCLSLFVWACVRPHRDGGSDAGREGRHSGAGGEVHGAPSRSRAGHPREAAAIKGAQQLQRAQSRQTDGS